MHIYGLLITKDDHEAFADWCRDQLPLYEQVVCLDGSESDETRRQAREFSDRLIYRHEQDFTIPAKSDHGLRRVVHDELVRRFGSGIWIMCCHTDEFCYHDPKKIAARAEREGYDQVSWFSPQFYPHPSELPDLEDRRRLSLPDRWQHYHWDYFGSGLPWIEDRLYRACPGVEWDAITHGSVRPHGLTRPAPFRPIFRHFKVCSLDLAAFEPDGQATHYRQHWQQQAHRTGLPLRVTRVEDLFVDSVPNYGACSRFRGVFDQPWNIGEVFRVEGAAVPTARWKYKSACRWERPGETGRIACSLVISVLESYEVVRRQCSHLQEILPDDWELILLDDGSEPLIPLPAVRPRHFTMVHTRSTASWTQPMARNLGARLARGKYLFFTDIDHILSREAVEAVRPFTGARMLFRRSFAVLDEAGRVCQERDRLCANGWTDDQAQRLAADGTVHQNTFVVRRELFLDALNGGYDESLCSGGQYGGDDTELNERYAKLIAAGRAEPDELGPEIYVYPDPASSKQFHGLARTSASR